MRRALRFVPSKVQMRDFRKFARTHGELPKNSDDEYFMRDLTLEDVQEIFDAGWEAAERRQERGGAGCGA